MRDEINGKWCPPGYHRYEKDGLILVRVRMTKDFSNWSTKGAIKTYCRKLMKWQDHKKLKLELRARGIFLNRKVRYIDDGFDPDVARYIGFEVTTLYSSIEAYKEYMSLEFHKRLAERFIADGWEIKHDVKYLDGSILL